MSLYEYYRHVKPENGWAYSPIELEAIWEKNIEARLIAETLENVHEFHLRTAKLKSNAQRDLDRRAAKLIQRAVVAEAVNNPPKFMVNSVLDEFSWPCPSSCEGWGNKQVK